MSGPRIGSLFSGYGGLDRGVMAALGGSVAWHVEFDKAPSKILAHHWPDVPNYGDVTAVDWSAVEPVDIITGGSPCQDLSHAGKRQGMTEGTRSNLWVAMREAIAQLRPGLVVWENVRGAYSAAADSEVEPCAGCVGERPGVSLRALGRVLGDLSDLGYDCRWHGLRAADIGAPHGRFRVFVAAYPRDGAGYGEWARPESREGSALAAVAADLGHERAGASRGGWDGPADGGLLPTPTTRDFKGHNQRGDDTCLTGALMPTPRATDGTKGGPNQRGSSGDLMLPSAVTLLPTPAVNDMGEGKTPEAWDEWTAKMQAAHGNGNGHGKSLAIEAQRLLGTPTARDGKGSGQGERLAESARRGQVEAQVRLATEGCEALVGDDVAGRILTSIDGEQVAEVLGGFGTECDRHGTSEPWIFSADQTSESKTSPWGIYVDAIARWEHLTRPAPAPTQPSKKGTPQLSPAFSEWLMGLPEGHVTEVPGLSRNDMLKALGNGVVPQQATAALRFLLGVQAVAA